MAVISNKLWNGEYLKCVIKFDDNTTYTVYNNRANNNNFIYSASFSLKDGNTNVNPLGINESSVLYLKLYDVNDYLSPLNTNSPYYNKMNNGVEIDMFISYDGSTWSDYGVWYVTSWSGGYSIGGHELTSITCEDKINVIGNMDLPLLPAYADVYSGSLIRTVLTSCGINNNDIVIDEACNKWMAYGVYNGTKVRDFLNNICQNIIARIIVDRHGKIRVIPALNLKESYDELDLSGNELGSLQNKLSRAVDFNKLELRYLSIVDKDRKELFRKTMSFASGTSRTELIRFYDKCLSLEQVQIEGDGAQYINNTDYTSYQGGLVIDMDCSSAINNVTVYGSGLVANTKEEVLTANIQNSGNKTYGFNTEQMMSENDAISLKNSLVSYFENIKNQILISGCILTPRLNIGDLVVIEDATDVYNGRYRVSNLDISFGTDYNVECTLIRLEASNG
jgi:hypothetical protein